MCEIMMQIEVLTRKFKAIRSVGDLDSVDNLIKAICDTVFRVSLIIVDPMKDSLISYEPNDATIVGLMVKQHKCFRRLIDAYERGSLGIDISHFRVNLEAYVKMLYLINGGEEARKEFRIKSYKNRYEEYKRGGEDAISTVFYNKFLTDLAADGLNLSDLDCVTNWHLGNTSFRGLLKKIDREEIYNLAYGLMSDPIHSDWGDIRQNHLQYRNNGQYVIRLDENIYPLRINLSFVYMHLYSLTDFITWNSKELNNPMRECSELIAEIRRVTDLVAKYYEDHYTSTSSIALLE